VIKQLQLLSQLVVLPHSVFALPFALASLLLAARGVPGQKPLPITLTLIIYVIGAVVSARTAAMAFNRLVDASFDLRNPRTKDRHLPAGQISFKTVAILVCAASGVFLVFAALLGAHCLLLAPLVLLVLLGYSFAKRFTAYSHLVLGLALGLAPGGAWWVLRPEFSLTPILLMTSVLLWVAGFDVLYSCQDLEFDREQKLFSIPAKFGLGRALTISLVLHQLAAVGFMLVGAAAGMGIFYYLGVFLLSAILLWQHKAISTEDLSGINRSFFTFNGAVSLGYLLLVLLTR